MAQTSISTSTASLEQVQREAPFGEKQLMWSWLFVGTFGVAITAGISWRRLGQPQRVASVIALCFFFLVLIDFLVVFLSYRVLQSSPYEGLALSVGTAIVVNVLFGWIMARMQKPYYREWVAAHGGREPTFRERGGWRLLLRIMVSSVVVSLLFNATIGASFHKQIILPLVSALTPAAVFSDPAFDLTYTGRWSAADPNDLNPELCQQLECVLRLVHADGQAAFQILRQDDSLARMASLEFLAQGSWDEFEQVDGAALLQAPTTVELDGQPAQQAEYTLPAPELPKGQFTRLILVTKQPDDAFLTILADTLAALRLKLRLKSKRSSAVFSSSSPFIKR